VVLRVGSSDVILLARQRVISLSSVLCNVRGLQLGSNVGSPFLGGGGD
jgi:hypothetical protein